MLMMTHGPHAPHVSQMKDLNPAALCSMTSVHVLAAGERSVLLASSTPRAVRVFGLTACRVVDSEHNRTVHSLAAGEGSMIGASSCKIHGPVAIFSLSRCLLVHSEHHSCRVWCA